MQQAVPGIVGILLFLLLWRAWRNSWATSRPGQGVGQRGEAVQRSVLPEGPNDQGIGWNILRRSSALALALGLLPAGGIPPLGS